MTVITTPKVVAPPEFVAVTVYVAELVIAVGVPEITPVEVLKLKPDGKLGDTANELTVPETVGNKLVIVVPTVKIFGELYERLVTPISLTVITTPKVVEPPELVAVTV